MLELNNVSKSYLQPGKKGLKEEVKAIENINLHLKAGISYGVVGESGAGKSTLSRVILGLEKPDKGAVCYEKYNLANMNNKQQKDFRRNMQVVFQDSFSSLNPKMKIYDSIKEPIKNHMNLSYKEEKKKIDSLLSRVGLKAEDGEKYPHQFSGGQQKRICIARAIGANPKFIVFDEAVSGLDSTVKKNILDLLKEIREELTITYFFITHDIEVALYMAQEIFIMKDGNIIEEVKDISLKNNFKHPYSKLLIGSVMPLKHN